MLQRLGSIINHRRYLSLCASAGGLGEGESDQTRFFGYPQNHNYHYSSGRLVPSLKLFERYTKILKCYPEQFSSLLDISACRGFYVLDASSRFRLDEAMGIDVVPEFIDDCKKAGKMMNDAVSHFEVSTLEDMHARCALERKQFDVTILIGSYHYFYWGSAQDPLAYRDHDRILRMVADLTRKTLVFSGRLDIKELPDYPKKVAASSGNRELYTSEEFLRCASRYFHIERKGSLGKSALFVLNKR